MSSSRFLTEYKKVNSLVTIDFESVRCQWTATTYFVKAKAELKDARIDGMRVRVDFSVTNGAPGYRGSMGRQKRQILLITAICTPYHWSPIAGMMNFRFLDSWTLHDTVSWSAGSGSQSSTQRMSMCYIFLPLFQFLFLNGHYRVSINYSWC